MMRKFILLLISFIVITFAAIALSIFAANKKISTNAVFKIPENIDKVVLGHSHPECAYNDTIILNSRNFASSGESYFFTYFKIAELLKQNSHIRTVFVELTNNQISGDMNDWIWDEEHMTYRYQLYAPFMDTEANRLLWSKNFRAYVNSLSISTKNSFTKIIGKDYDFTKKIGGFLYLERDKTDSLVAMINEREADSSNQEISEKNLYYLDKIIKECKKQNVNVYLVRSPLHEKYTGPGNERLFWQVVRLRFAGTEFLDFKNFPAANSEFGDLEHLNHKGAKKFSAFFNELLQNGLLEVSDKQAFINRAMQTPQ